MSKRKKAYNGYVHSKIERRYSGDVLEAKASKFITKLDTIIKHNDNLFRDKLDLSLKEIDLSRSLKNRYDYTNGIIFNIKGNISIIISNIQNYIYTNNDISNKATSLYLVSLANIEENLAKAFDDAFNLFLYWNEDRDRDYSKLGDKLLKRFLHEAIEAFENSYNYYINIFYIDIAMDNKVLLEEINIGVKNET